MGSGQGFFHSHRSQGKEGSGAVLVSIGDETRSGLKRGGVVLTLRTPLTTLQSWLLGGLMPKVLGGSSTVMKRLFLIVTVFFGISLWSRGDVLITEILASNFEIEADEFGGQSDWLELYNSSVQSVNLKGWHLPERVLSGGEVVRVWCSGKDQVTPSGEMHADFRLSAPARPSLRRCSIIGVFPSMPISPSGFPTPMKRLIRCRPSPGPGIG